MVLSVLICKQDTMQLALFMKQHASENLLTVRKKREASVSVLSEKHTKGGECEVCLL